MLTPAQLATLEANGCITVDTPFTAAELNRVESEWDTYHGSGWQCHAEADGTMADLPPGEASSSHTASSLRTTVLHPFLRRVAQQALRSQGVRCHAMTHAREPTPRPVDPGEWPPDLNEIWQGKRQDICGGCHVDIQQTLHDLDSTPQRAPLSMWLWLSDVTEDSGAMRILEGSHRVLARHWQDVLDPVRLSSLPRVRSLRPDPDGWCRRSAARATEPWPLPHFPEGLAEIRGRPRWHEQRPTATVAKRGQLLVLTQGALHSASFNASSSPRKAVTLGWMSTELLQPIEPRPVQERWPEAFVPRL
jgi:hypothetical protein